MLPFQESQCALLPLDGSDQPSGSRTTLLNWLKSNQTGLLIFRLRHPDNAIESQITCACIRQSNWSWTGGTLRAVSSAFCPFFQWNLYITIFIGFVLRAFYWNSGLSVIINNNLIKGICTSADSSPALPAPIKVSLSKILNPKLLPVAGWHLA